MSWRERHPNAVLLPWIDADRLMEARRYEARDKPGAKITAISPRPDGSYSMTLHRAAEMPWNARRRPVRI